MSAKGSYPKGVAKREEILRTALEIFSQQGYRGTSLREVARACGLSLPGLMHYFESKEELLTAILRKRDEHDLALAGAVGEDPFRQLSAIVRHNADVPGLVQLYATLSAAASDPAHPAHEFFRERYRALRAGLARAVRERQAAGLIPAGLDAQMLATMVLALADGLQVQWMLDDGIDMAAHLDYLLEAMAAPPATRESAAHPPGAR